jgi:DMSO/TMAO reductase YedYZ heme-binding membrane subunit
MIHISGTLPWYVARSSGLVAWTLLAAAVAWGLLMTSGAVRAWAKNSWLLDLHRALGGLALVFTAVHVGAILADTYVHFGLVSVLVPFAASWHPVAVSWGVASLYLLVAVECTSLLRRHLRPNLWRRVHYASFPLFVFATVHGLSAGTDGRTPMAIAAVVTAGSATTFLVVARQRARRRAAQRRAEVRAVASPSRQPVH